jgi:hypothetical protein
MVQFRHNRAAQLKGEIPMTLGNVPIAKQQYYNTTDE